MKDMMRMVILPLWLLQYQQLVRLFLFLIECGADLYARVPESTFEFNASDLAIHHKRELITQLLLEHMDPKRLGHSLVTASLNFFAIVKMLVEHGILVDNNLIAGKYLLLGSSLLDGKLEITSFIFNMAWSGMRLTH